MTLALMRFAPGLAPTVVGGQVGSYVNSRLPEETTLRDLMTGSFLVGTFVVRVPFR